MTRTPNLTFRGDSLAARVIGFFQNNPDEELDLEAITEKFDATRGNIHTLLAPATQAGALVRDRNKDGDYIYKAGKNLPAAPNGQTVADPFTKPAKKAHSGHQAPRKVLDIDKLKVEEGIPYTLDSAHKGASKWQPLFDKLTKPGQSIAIPGDMRGAVGAAAGKVNKTKKHGSFRVAMTGPDTARIWRIA